MKALEIVLIIVFAILALLVFIALAVYARIKLMLKHAGIDNIFKEIKASSDQMKASQKSISGMTKLLEPIILEDFKSFNKEELYNRSEKNLRTIFGALENYSMDGFSDMSLLYDIVKKQIEDMQNDNIKVEYKGSNEMGLAKIILK